MSIVGDVMKWRGKVDQYLRSVRQRSVLHFSLVDPEKIGDINQLKSVLECLVAAGTDAILIGGSLSVMSYDVDVVVDVVEELGVPSILFPGSVAGISPRADAILFLSLLNSDDVYYIVGAQVYAAPLIKRFGIEVLPTAYLIVGYGGAAGYMGRARPIPYEKPEIGAAFALAAKYMGMRYIYLEAGSGAPSPIPPSFVKYVRAVVGDDVFIIVGGGIRSPEIAFKLAHAGADAIVTGTVIEQNPQRAADIVKAIKSASKGV